MSQGGDKAANRPNATNPGMLPSDFNQKLREPLAKSLTKVYRPPEDSPPKLDELLGQLKDAAGE